MIGTFSFNVLDTVFTVTFRTEEAVREFESVTKLQVPV